MPNSLKCRLKKFVNEGLLSEKDLSRLYTDNDVITELEHLKVELIKIYQEEIKNDSRWSAGVKYSCKIIDNHIKELKGENE